MGACINITGQRFGRLTVLQKAKSRNGRSAWLCRCDCGVEKDILTQSLRSGLTKSCGCYSLEVSASLGRASATHGLTKSPEYSVFSGIKRRCNNENDKSYHKYGGAGIECRLNSFEEFLDEVGERPSPEHTIDRIDTLGHYEVGNLRWATIIQQNRNRKNTLRVKFRGKDERLTDLCDLFRQPYRRVWARIFQRGWDVERALIVGVATT